VASPRAAPPRSLAPLALVDRHPRLAVALAAVVPFLLTLGNPPVLDDGWAALDNPLVWSLGNVGRMFTEPYGYAGDPSVRGPFRPITTLSYALGYALHGRATPGYHAVNLALHALASVLVAALALRLARAAMPERAGRLALLAGLIFALHPAHVEAVATIFGRTEPLSASFALGALLFALRWRERWWRLPAAVLLLTAGVLSKEVAIVVPALFLLVALAAPAAAGLGARPALAAGGRRALLQAAGVAGALSLAAVPYFLVRGPNVGVAPVARWFPLGTPPEHVALTMSRVLGEYLRILVYPAFLGGDFAYAGRIPTLAAATPAFWIATLAWVAALVAGAALLATRRAPIEGAGILWTFVALTPVLQIVPVGVLLAERLLYLPSAGACLAAAAALSRALPAARAGADPARPAPAAHAARAWAALAIAALALLAGRTVVRTFDWRTNLALWESELAKAPRDVVVNNNLAVEYTSRGEYRRALERLDVALRAAPWYWRAEVNRGIALHGLGDLDGALRALARAGELAPRDPSPRYHAGWVLGERGDYRRALEELAAAERLAPEDTRTVLLAATYLAAMDRVAEARAKLRRAAALDPRDPEPQRRLAALEGR